MLSIITNLLNLSFYYLIPLWLGLLSIILYIFFQEKRQQSSLIKEELKESKTLFRMYIDRFFIVSKIKTFSLCSIYIFGNSLLFILIRYMYLGQITPLIISPVTSNLWLLIFIYIKLGITIILYKILLDVLFGSEINKLYLYIIHNRWYWKYVRKLLSFRLGEYVIGCLRVPCYRIATFTYQGEYISGNLPQFIHNDELNYHIQNDIIIRIIKKMQDLAIQYRIIKELFAVLAYILRFFHIHINGINEHLPYLILFIIFVIEFQNKQFRYIYIAFFIFLLIKSKRDIVRFSQKRAYMYDANLSRYFYSNDIGYKIQRTSFYNDNKIAIDTNKYSYQNNAIDNNYPKIVDYIFNNFKSSSYPARFRRRIAGVYRRFLLTLTIVSIAIYLLIYKSSMYHIEALVFVNIPLIVLFIPVLVMIYCSYKTYYPKSYKEDPTDAEWIYNRKHNIIFWIVTVMQLYIFWILLFKPELIFADTEVLFNYIITITKTYTIEDKIMYIYQYFDYYIQSTLLTVEEQDLLRDKLRQINFQEIINETITLKDIKMNIRAFIATEYYRDHVIIIEKIMELYTEKENSWYNLLRNILIISGISTGILKTISYYDSLLTVLQGLQDVDGIGRISHEVGRIFYKHANQYEFKFHLFDLFGNANKYKNTIYLSQIFETKLSSLLDILLYYGLDTIPLQVRIILTGIIAGFVSTIVLPRIIHFFEKPVLIESKVNIIFLDDMSTIAVIAPYNLYYYCFGVTFLMVISVLVFIKKAQMKLHMKDKDYRKS